jgi:membrane-associated phospholipid phosphatase
MRQLMLSAWLAASLLVAAPVAAEPSRNRTLWQREWPVFSWTEGALTLAAGLGTAALALQEPPADPHWRGGVLFDDAVRDSVRLSSPTGRQTARSIGDMPYYAAGVLPLIVDPLIVAWWSKHDGKAAVNLELMGIEAFSYAGLLSFVSTRLSVRERPDTTECRRNELDDSRCEPDTEAFWSGHTSIVAASAGLVCAHHQYLPLWGGGAGDVVACALATSGALVTAGSRLLADRHYATDVVVGLGVGFAAGYAVPTLLHYRRRRADVAVWAQPELGSGATLRLAGTF